MAIDIPIQLKRSSEPGKVPQPSDLQPGQLAVNLIDGKLYTKNDTNTIIQLGLVQADFATVATSGSYNDLIDKPTITTYVLPVATASILGGVKQGSGVAIGTDGTLSASVISVAGSDGTAKTGAVVITRSDIGLDILDANDKIMAQYLPDSITGAMIYQGTWNASTNTPTIPAADSTNLGWLYVVSTAGTTDIDGNADWQVGDWLLSNGSVWQQIRTTGISVVSVNGATGAVTVDASNLPGLSVVGRTGSYNDLLDVPTVFNPDTTQPYPATSITGLAPVATTGSYNSLTDLPPDPGISNVGFMAVGQPTLLDSVRYPFTEAVEFQQDWAGSIAFFTLYTGTVATVQLNRIRAGTPAPVGSIQYTQSTGAVVFTSTETTPRFEIGDMMEWVWPAGIATFTCNMKGTRQ